MLLHPPEIKMPSGSHQKAYKHSSTNHQQRQEKPDIGRIAHTLGKPHKTPGGGWLCLCPAHDDKTPSLSLGIGRDGELLAYCYAGCDFRDILAALRNRGLVAGNPPAGYKAPLHYKKIDDAEENRRRSEWPKTIWLQSSSALCTLAERYLRLRGYTGDIPATIRFHKSLKNKFSGQYHPALVAAIQNPDGKISAVHVIFLNPETGNKINIPDVKAKLNFGLVKGGAVRLSKPSDNDLVESGKERCRHKRCLSTLSGREAAMYVQCLAA